MTDVGRPSNDSPGIIAGRTQEGCGIFGDYKVGSIDPFKALGDAPRQLGGLWTSLSEHIPDLLSNTTHEEVEELKLEYDTSKQNQSYKYSNRSSLSEDRLQDMRSIGAVVDDHRDDDGSSNMGRQLEEQNLDVTPPLSYSRSSQSSRSSSTSESSIDDDSVHSETLVATKGTFDTSNGRSDPKAWKDVTKNEDQPKNVQYEEAKEKEQHGSMIKNVKNETPKLTPVKRFRPKPSPPGGVPWSALMADIKASKKFVRVDSMLFEHSKNDEGTVVSRVSRTWKTSQKMDVSEPLPRNLGSANLYAMDSSIKPQQEVRKVSAVVSSPPMVSTTSTRKALSVNGSMKDADEISTASSVSTTTSWRRFKGRPSVKKLAKIFSAKTHTVSVRGDFLPQAEVRSQNALASIAPSTLRVPSASSKEAKLKMQPSHEAKNAPLPENLPLKDGEKDDDSIFSKMSMTSFLTGLGLSEVLKPVPDAVPIVGQNEGRVQQMEGNPLGTVFPNMDRNANLDCTPDGLNRSTETLKRNETYGPASESGAARGSQSEAMEEEETQGSMERSSLQSRFSWRHRSRAAISSRSPVPAEVPTHRSQQKERAKPRAKSGRSPRLHQEVISKRSKSPFMSRWPSKKKKWTNRQRQMSSRATTLF